MTERGVSLWHRGLGAGAAPLWTMKGHRAFLAAPRWTKIYHHWEIPCLEGTQGTWYGAGTMGAWSPRTRGACPPGLQWHAGLLIHSTSIILAGVKMVATSSPLEHPSSFPKAVSQASRPVAKPALGVLLQSLLELVGNWANLDIQGKPKRKPTGHSGTDFMSRRWG